MAVRLQNSAWSLADELILLALQMVRIHLAGYLLGGASPVSMVSWTRDHNIILYHMLHQNAINTWPILP